MAGTWSFGAQAATTLTNAVTATIGTTLSGIYPAATTPAFSLKFLRHWIGQSGSATSAQQTVALWSFRPQTAQATLGTAQNPVPVQQQNTTTCSVSGSTTLAAAKCGIGSSGVTEQTVGTGQIVYLWNDAFNVLNGYLKVNTPDECEVFAVGATNYARLCLLTTPSPTTGWSWGQVFTEL